MSSVNIHNSSVRSACPAEAVILLFSWTLNNTKPANGQSARGCSLAWPRYLCMGGAEKVSMLSVR